MARKRGWQGLLRREPYLLLVTFSSVIMYGICMYSFLAVSGLLGHPPQLPTDGLQLYSDRRTSAEPVPAVPNRKLQYGGMSAKAAASSSYFDDGKAHEFERNVASPVDWDMAAQGTDLVHFKTQGFKAAEPPSQPATGNKKRIPHRKKINVAHDAERLLSEAEPREDGEFRHDQERKEEKPHRLKTEGLRSDWQQQPDLLAWRRDSQPADPALLLDTMPRWEHRKLLSASGREREPALGRHNKAHSKKRNHRNNNNVNGGHPVTDYVWEFAEVKEEADEFSPAAEPSLWKASVIAGDYPDRLLDYRPLGDDGLPAGTLEEILPPLVLESRVAPAIVANDSSEVKSELPVVKDPLFPPDLFTPEERASGAIIFHVLGVMYMFVALAIVCDEFFVPSLDVIIEKLAIPDDVAGATFMAAGGSAPELFTSVIGVFVSFDDVGIGTIVGSAVFNILFVIGMCALFSKTVLTLTWWPLFRDCTFYSFSLITLVLFFMDNYIQWWEALLLLGIYAAYVTFMRFNETVEKALKGVLYKNTIPRISSTDHLVTHSTRGPPSQGSVSSSGPGAGSAAAGVVGAGLMAPLGALAGTTGSLRPGSAGCRGSKFRAGLLQLMIHSIDPMHDGHIDEKANKLHAIASLKVLLDATKAQNGASPHHTPVRTRPDTSHADDLDGNGRSSQDTELTPVDSLVNSDVDAKRPNGITVASKSEVTRLEAGVNGTAIEESGDDDKPEPLDMSWPDTTRRRITYVLLAPILVPLWLTLPDTKTPRGKRFFVVTFVGSILWIAAFSYLMVWWANLAGETFHIPPEVMGLTFLAAGTSIPDLITSVIVARKGLGDMAVSSSVGSNIFDVCVGLPLPWFLYGVIMGKPVEVSSAGMACSILILFGMLMFVVGSIACFKWKMNKPLGVTMFLFYFVFVALSLGFEYGYLTCPV